MKFKNLVFLILIAVVIVSVASISYTQFFSQQAASKVAKIGAIEPLSGVFASLGQKHLRGMQFAVDEINLAGGINGIKLELVVADSKSDPKEAVTIFRRMVEIDGIVAAAGPVSSSVGVALAEEANKLEVPLFLHQSGSHKVLKPEHRYTFRMCEPNVMAVNEAYVNFIQQMGFKRIGVIVADYELGHSVKEGVEKFIVPLPDVKVQIEVAPLDTTDFTPYLRKLQDLDPEFLLLAGHPPGSFIVPKQARELGFKSLKMYLGPGFNPEIVVSRLGGEAFLGAVDKTCVDYGSEAYKEIAERYYSKMQDFMDASAVTGYVTVYRIADAIKAAQSLNPKKIAEIIREGRYVHPIYAWPLSYTENGELKEATPIFITYKLGRPPGNINPAADWHIEVIYKSPPIKPFIP